MTTDGPAAPTSWSVFLRPLGRVEIMQAAREASDAKALGER